MAVVVGEQGGVSVDFAQVVADGHPHGQRIAGQLVGQAQAVAKDAVGVPARRACRDGAGGLKLRKPGGEGIALGQDAEKTPWNRSGQGLAQLAGHALCREGGQGSGGQSAHLGEGCGVDAPVGPESGKTGQAENAGRVVGKGRGRGRA